MKNKLTGRLIRAGNIQTDNGEVRGCLVEIDQETLRDADELPLYCDCIILSMDHYKRITNEASIALGDAEQSDVDCLRALHERNELREEIKCWKNKWECVVEIAAQAHLKADDYKTALMAINEIYIDASDIASDYEAMGEIASKALTEDEE
jgi:hypothetical protein